MLGTGLTIDFGKAHERLVAMRTDTAYVKRVLEEMDPETLRTTLLYWRRMYLESAFSALDSGVRLQGANQALSDVGRRMANEMVPASILIQNNGQMEDTLRDLLTQHQQKLIDQDTKSFEDQVKRQCEVLDVTPADLAPMGYMRGVLPNGTSVLIRNPQDITELEKA